MSLHLPEGDFTPSTGGGGNLLGCLGIIIIVIIAACFFYDAGTFNVSAIPEAVKGKWVVIAFISMAILGWLSSGGN